MVKITSCVYQSDHRFVFALCHNTRTTHLKAKLLSTHLQNMVPKNIQVIHDFTERTESANQIIIQSLSQAVSSHLRSNPNHLDILEFIYFGDVNLTYPGMSEYPSLLINKNEFSTMIRGYFPNCIVVKRILVSGDEHLIEDVKIRFAELGRQDFELPVIIDSFLNKSHTDLYTDTHLIDTRLIDAILNHHRAFQTEESKSDDFDCCSKIEVLIKRLDDNLICLSSNEGHPLTFDFIRDFHQELQKESKLCCDLAHPALFVKKSILMSLAFSYLIPASLRDRLLSCLMFKGVYHAVISVGKINHPDLGELLMDIVDEQQAYFKKIFCKVVFYDEKHSRAI